MNCTRLGGGGQPGGGEGRRVGRQGVFPASGRTAGASSEAEVESAGLLGVARLAGRAVGRQRLRSRTRASAAAITRAAAAAVARSRQRPCAARKRARPLCCGARAVAAVLREIAHVAQMANPRERHGIRLAAVHPVKANECTLLHY